jgi:hypothetical protein
MTAANAKLNAQSERNAQIKVLAMQYALQARAETEDMEVTIANAGKIYEFMKDTASVTSLEVVRTLPESA